MAHDVMCEKKVKKCQKRGEQTVNPNFPFLCLAHLPPYVISEKMGVGGKRQVGKPPLLVTGGGQTMRKRREKEGKGEKGDKMRKRREKEGKGERGDILKMCVRREIEKLGQ